MNLLKNHGIRKHTAVLLLLLLSTLPCLASGSSDKSAPDSESPAVISITDLAGRTVEVKLPVKHVVLASARYLHEFAAVGGADVLDTINGWGSDLKKYDMDTYLTYKEAYPEKIAAIKDVGYHYSGTFSTETVISLAPDVVVFPLWLQSSDGVSADIEKLAKAGIPSIFLDYYQDPFNNPVPSTRIIGQLLGKEDRAREIIDFYESQVKVVSDRLKNYKGPKTTAYIEVGSKGPSEYGNTYSSSQGLGALIAKAGGIDIVDGEIDTTAPINPEFLLKADPDVIIISGSYWPSNKTSMRLGYHADETSSRAILDTFTRRNGWQYLSAVKNKKVYSLFHGFSFRIYNFAGIQAVACWLYPDLFSDIDPAQSFKEFMEKFSPVPYSGAWVLGLDDK